MSRHRRPRQSRCSQARLEASLAALARPHDIASLARALAIPRGSAQSAVRQLRRDGRIAEAGRDGKRRFWVRCDDPGPPPPATVLAPRAAAILGAMQPGEAHAIAAIARAAGPRPGTVA